MAFVAVKNCGKFAFLRDVSRRINYSTKLSVDANKPKHTDVKVTLSNGNTLNLSTGKYAKMADGCAVATMGDTSVMVTSVGGTPNPSSNFVPLSVEYRQKSAAAGRIPMNFFRRDLRRTDQEVLASRLIDRSLRPLFPKGYNSDVQMICNTLAIDGQNDPEILAINAASASLAVSNIPWNGPVAAVRIGIIGEEFIVNPTRRQMQECKLDLVISALNSNLVVMMEGTADNILEQDLKKAIKMGAKECGIITSKIKELQKACGKEKKLVEVDEPPSDYEEIEKLVDELSNERLRKILCDYSLDKLGRDVELNNLREETVNSIVEKLPEANQRVIANIYEKIKKDIFRNLILDTDKRCDGRSLEDVRNISCEVGLYDVLHGSALFQRGQTQVLCTVTLDSIESALKLDPITMLTSGLKEKNFYLHYEFPNYATNEVKPIRAADRREIGHGALAERGLKFAIPTDFPFAIRLTSEVLESNGSSSMATVCGGSMALMDAGVPIASPVAGVAMGLITKYDDKDKLEDYRILTDLLGIEDYLGDMDFKIAGSKKGFTALQADIKLPGVPLKIIMEALTQAISAKAKILGIMNEAISAPRKDKKDNMPVLETLDIPEHKHAKFVGVGKRNLKQIFLQTGVHIYHKEGSQFCMFAPNPAARDEAKELVDKVLAAEKEPTLEFGGIYTAKVVEVLDIGVMVSLYPSMPPTLLHNSQLDQRSVSHPSALGLEVGQELQVKYFGRDPVNGKMRLSRKILQSTIPTIKNFASNKSS